MIDKKTRAKEIIKILEDREGHSVHVEFHFVENIDSAWWDWADEETIRNTPDIYKDLSGCCGLCTPAKGGVYHIFIRNDYKFFDSVVCHEYIHALDMERFKIELNNEKSDIGSNRNYKYFLFYTEFHAYFYETVFVLLSIKDECRTNYTTKCLSNCLKSLNRLKNDTSKEYCDYYYELSHSLAIIRAAEIFKNDISKYKIKEFEAVYDVLVKLIEFWSKENIDLLKVEVDNIDNVLDLLFEKKLSEARKKTRLKGL